MYINVVSLLDLKSIVFLCINNKLNVKSQFITALKCQVPRNKSNKWYLELFAENCKKY